MKSYSKSKFLMFFCLIAALLSACSVGNNKNEFTELENDNNEINSLFEEAQIAFSQEDYEKSVNLYDEIISLDSQSIDAFLGMLDALMKLDLKDESAELIDEINSAFDLNEQQLKKIEEHKKNLNKKDISLVQDDIKKYITQLLHASVANKVPEFSSLQELNLDYAIVVAIYELFEESKCEKYVFTLDEVEGKIHQIFGESYNLDTNNFTFGGSIGVYWDEEINSFSIEGFGPNTVFMGKVIDVNEMNDSYEARVLYFDILNYDYDLAEPLEIPLILQNNKVIGHIKTLSDGTEEYIFYKSIDELTVHHQRFIYESDEKLIWTSCEIYNKFEPVTDFTTEIATQYLYDYFDVNEDDVYFDMRTETPYEDGWGRKYHYFRWYNIPKEGMELGGNKGPYMWVDQYGQVYADSEKPLIYNYQLPYNPEVKFSIRD